MMKNAVLVAVFLLLWTGASAQIAERLQAEVYGSILDASDLQPIPYVNVYVQNELSTTDSLEILLVGEYYGVPLRNKCQPTVANYGRCAQICDKPF